MADADNDTEQNQAPVEKEYIGMLLPFSLKRDT